MRHIFFITTLCSFFSTQLFAGWASGGGMIHRDELNPWFLENTKMVHYCIDIDEPQFGVSLSEARVQIEWAIKEWKSAFDIAEDDYYEPNELEPYDNIRIATQKFVEVSCQQENVDLRFQLGTLTAEQKNLFEKPEDYVGIAFRTEYDLENLKGTGFVYIAPTKGVLKPNSSNILETAWSQFHFFALKLVLIHELGHVFGIAHTPSTVMDTLFPEMLITKDFSLEFDQKFADHILKYYSLARLFGFRDSLDNQGCGEHNPIRDSEVFELDPKLHANSCGRVLLLTGNGKRQIYLYYSETGDISQMTLIAKGELPNMHTSSNSALSLYLPAEQKVFTKFADFDINRRLFGEQILTSKRFTGTLEMQKSGHKLPIRIQFSQGDTEFSVIYNNTFRDYAIWFDI